MKSKVKILVNCTKGASNRCAMEFTQEDKLRDYPQHTKILIQVAAPGQVNYTRWGTGYHLVR